MQHMQHSVMIPEHVFLPWAPLTDLVKKCCRNKVFNKANKLPSISSVVSLILFQCSYRSPSMKHYIVVY